MVNDEIQNIRNRTIGIVQNYFSEEAEDTLRQIKSLENEKEILENRNLFEELKIYKVLLEFINFVNLPEERQIHLFKNYLIKAYKVGIDVPNRFFLKLETTPSVLWPETFQLFIEAILANEEKIGINSISIQGEMEKVPPTLKNWLRDYNRNFGVDRQEKIIPHRYIAENSNAKNLNQEDKIILLKVIEFYESLKLPSKNQFLRFFERYLAQNEDKLEKEFDDYIDESDSQIVEDDLVSNIQDSSWQSNEDIYSDSIDILTKNFPKVSDQEITREPIKFINGEVVRPTISNWLSDYQSYSGAGRHEIGERSNYLLRSPNVQNLSLEERVRLGLVLRSHDEGYILTISTKEQEILFNRSIEKVAT